MRKITIGCKNDSNIVSFLKEDFNVVSPYIYYKNGQVIKNFDVYLIFDEILNDNAKQILRGIPTFGHRRMGKDEQSMHFHRLKINHPMTYCTNILGSYGSRDDVNYLLLKDIPEDEKLILKANNGARGIGQAMLTKNEIYKLIDMCKVDNIDYDKILSTFKIGAKDSFTNQLERNFIGNTINNSEYIIQRRVKVSDEWRYVYFYKQEPMLIKRSVDGTWQSNTSITGKGEPIKYDSKNNDHLKMAKIAEILAKDLNVPFLSIDFYKESDTCEIGVFEQQMQLGYALMPKSELVNNTINSVSAYINDFLITKK